MTVSVQEQMSRGLLQTWESASIVRDFIVMNDGADLTLETATGADGVPLFGTSHPTLGWPATRVSADFHHDQTAVVVSVEYKDLVPEWAGDSFSNISVLPQIQTVDGWKRGVLPNEADFTDGVSDVLGGTWISRSANPVSLHITTATVSIQHEYRGEINVAFWNSIIGVRNTDPFLGFPEYSLLYVGMSVRRIGSVWQGGGETDPIYEITHTIYYDQHLHARQFLDSYAYLGQPPLDSDGHPTGLQWVQPFTNTRSFGALDIPV